MNDRNVFSSRYLLIVMTLILLAELNLYPSYFLYLIVGVWGIVNFQPKQKFERFIIAFLLLSLSSYIKVFEYNARMLFDVTLTFIGVLPFINAKRIKIDVKILTYIAISVFFIFILPHLGSLSPSALMKFMISSDLETESAMLSFILPIFAIYWYLHKEYKFFIILFILTVIAGKRISVLALLGSITGYHITSYLDTSKKKNILHRLPLLALVSNSIYLFFSYGLVSGLFNKLIFNLTGLTSAAFTMGRQALYESVFKEFDVTNIGDLLFGETEVFQLLLTERIHNDVLIIFAENGIIVFCMFWLLYYRKFKIHSLPFLVYLNMLFLTDNTLIYIHVLFFICFFVRLVEQEFPEDIQQNESKNMHLNKPNFNYNS